MADPKETHLGSLWYPEELAPCCNHVRLGSNRSVMSEMCLFMLNEDVTRWTVASCKFVTGTVFVLPLPLIPFSSSFANPLSNFSRLHH